MTDLGCLFGFNELHRDRMPAAASGSAALRGRRRCRAPPRLQDIPASSEWDVGPEAGAVPPPPVPAARRGPAFVSLSDAEKTAGAARRKDRSASPAGSAADTSPAAVRRYAEMLLAQCLDRGLPGGDRRLALPLERLVERPRPLRPGIPCLRLFGSGPARPAARRDLKAPVSALHREAAIDVGRFDVQPPVAAIADHQAGAARFDLEVIGARYPVQLLPALAAVSSVQQCRFRRSRVPIAERKGSPDRPRSRPPCPAPSSPCLGSGV